VRFQRLYQADPATAQGGRTCGGVRWLASCTPRSRACGADIDSATNGWKIGREYIRRKNDGLVRDAVSLHAPGVEHVKQSPDRVDALKKIFNKHGAKIKDFYALLGQYDTLFIVDAPNDETVAKLSLYVAEQGNARVETHRAFTETEFRKLLSEID